MNISSSNSNDWISDDVRLPDEPTLLASFRAASQEPSDRDGFVFLQGKAETRRTYAQLWDEVEVTARHLISVGLHPGDRVGLLVVQPHDFVRSFLGVMRAGLIPVPMAPPNVLAELDAWVIGATKILSKARARAAIADSDVARVAFSLRDRVPSLRWFLDSKAIHQDRNAALPDVDEVTPDTLALLQFTSGSTGNPKGVCVTHRAMMANCDGILQHVLRVKRGQEVAVGWLPLYHDMGIVSLVICPIRSRTMAVIMSPLDFVKRPARWMTVASKYRGNITFAPNFAYGLAAKRPPSLDGLDLSGLRVLGCGAEPIRPQTLRQFADTFAPVGIRSEYFVPCYGMAESVVGVALVRAHEPMTTEWVDRDALVHGRAERTDDPQAGVELVCCGTPLPGHELEVIDEHGRVLPDRRIGEFRVRGASITQGYFEDPEASAEVFTAKGLKTGDLGYLVDGRAFVTGRRKELVIVDGRNYVPSDIEAVAEQVEGVRTGRVVAFSQDRGKGEVLVLVCESRTQPREGMADEVKRSVQRSLALAVDDVLIVPPGSLPRTSSGKLRRGETRRRYESNKLRLWSDSKHVDQLVVMRHLAHSWVSRVRERLGGAIRRSLTVDRGESVEPLASRKTTP